MFMRKIDLRLCTSLELVDISPEVTARKGKVNQVTSHQDDWSRKVKHSDGKYRNTKHHSWSPIEYKRHRSGSPIDHWILGGRREWDRRRHRSRSPKDSKNSRSFYDRRVRRRLSRTAIDTRNFRSSIDMRLNFRFGFGGRRKRYNRELFNYEPLYSKFSERFEPKEANANRLNNHFRICPLKSTAAECEFENCSLLHLGDEDKLFYMEKGLVSGNLLREAMRNAVFFSLPIEGKTAVCKSQLFGQCEAAHCSLLHFTQKLFVKTILEIVREKLKHTKHIGESECSNPSDEDQEVIVESLWNPVVKDTPTFNSVSQTPIAPPLDGMNGNPDGKWNGNEKNSKDTSSYRNFFDILNEENQMLLNASNTESGDDFYKGIPTDVLLSQIDSPCTPTMAAFRTPFGIMKASRPEKIEPVLDVLFPRTQFEIILHQVTKRPPLPRLSRDLLRSSFPQGVLWMKERHLRNYFYKGQLRGQELVLGTGDCKVKEDMPFWDYPVALDGFMALWEKHQQDIKYSQNRQR